MKRNADPYQWFFPAGIFFGVAGVGLWILFGLGRLQIYPGLLHSETMMAGFLMAFATGFLMTAVPRFTGTDSATVSEKVSMLLVMGALFIANFWIPNRTLFHVLVLLQIVLLLRFAVVRVRQAAFIPPPSFVLVGFGILSALFSGVVFVLGDITSLPPALLRFARLLFNYGVFMSLILGIGSQLIPAILGLQKTRLTQLQVTPLAKPAWDGRQVTLFSLYGFFLLASFILESAGKRTAGVLLRALLLSQVVLFHWRIYRLPVSRGVLHWCLWLSAWAFVLGAWPALFWPHQAIHLAHIFFIGSVSLMIFGIATRVTLAHGGYGLVLEQRSRELWLLLLFLILALGARLSVIFAGSSYSRHLAYAAGLWIFAVAVWSYKFVPLILKTRPKE